MYKFRPYRLKDGKYIDDKGKKHNFKGNQKDLIINLKKHAKYDLSKYNKLKAIEKSVKKVEETDINLKTSIRKNEYKDIKNIEDKIKNDEKLTDEEKQRYDLYINKGQTGEKLNVRDFDEVKDIIFNYSPSELKEFENFTAEEQKEINNINPRNQKKYIERLIKQKKINLSIEKMIYELFELSIPESNFKSDKWNGFKNGDIKYIRKLYNFLYNIHEKTKSDIYDYLLIEKNNKLNNPFQIFLSKRLDKSYSRENLINDLLKDITPARYNKFYELKYNIPNTILPGDLIGRAIKNYLPPLYESDINKYYDGNPKYINTYALDEIKNMKIDNNDLLHGRGFIVNNSNRNDNDDNNKHWTAVYLDKYNIELFDPLAKHLQSKKILEELKPIIEENNNMFKLKKNSNVVQNPLSYLCGYHCISFLNKKFDGKNFKEASEYNNDYKQNTKDIRKRFSFV